MRLILIHSEELTALSPLLVSELEQILERANAWSGVEHAGDGRHGAITVSTLQFRGSTQTTVGAAGGASAQPATPLGYLPVLLSDGTEVVIPYHLKA